jgi:hypothetical protein
MVKEWNKLFMPMTLKKYPNTSPCFRGDFEGIFQEGKIYFLKVKIGKEKYKKVQATLRTYTDQSPRLTLLTPIQLEAGKYLVLVEK